VGGVQSGGWSNDKVCHTYKPEAFYLHPNKWNSTVQRSWVKKTSSKKQISKENNKSRTGRESKKKKKKG
jgi:hypothetical protein